MKRDWFLFANNVRHLEKSAFEKFQSFHLSLVLTDVNSSGIIGCDIGVGQCGSRGSGALRSKRLET